MSFQPLVQEWVLHLLKGEVGAGHHRMEYGHVLGVLLQYEPVAHMVSCGDRRRNCFWA